MPKHAGGRPLRWTNKEIGRVLEEIYGEHGEITLKLLLSKYPGACSAIYQRIRKREFENMNEALGGIRLLHSTHYQTAGGPEQIEGLNGLVERKPGREGGKEGNTVPKEPKRGICAGCGKGPMIISSVNPRTRKNICRTCWEGSKVGPGIELPSEEGGAGGKTRYPTVRSAVAALKGRVSRGKEIYPSVLAVEKNALYRAAIGLGIELPREEGSRLNPDNLIENNLVVDMNPMSGVFGRPGKIIGVDGSEARVDFREDGGIIRVYQEGINLHHMVIICYPNRQRS